MGNKYTGSFREDQRDGWGIMDWIDGSIYKGQWSAGIQQGFGIMSYNTDLSKQDPNAPLKIRAGFFTSNVFSKPLVRLEEIKEKAGLDVSVLDEDVVQEVQQYLSNRLKKVEALAKKKGVQKQGLLESMIESEEEDVGQELKAAIVDARAASRTEMQSAAQENKDLIYDVKEEQMQNFKETDKMA